MGDRANICIIDNDTTDLPSRPAPRIFLYTHWAGSDLPEILARALVRANDKFGYRWNDPSYLTRIIFSEMLAFPLESISVNKWADDDIANVREYARDMSDSVFGTTGFGISTWCGDGGNRVIYVDELKQTVTIGQKTWTFAEYVALEEHTWEG